MRKALLAVMTAALAVAFACQSSSNGAPSCDPMCTGVPDCNGVSCLAYCIGVQSSCAALSDQSLFSSWASCGPVLSCIDDEFTSLTCASQAIATTACGPIPPDGSGTGSSVFASGSSTVETSTTIVTSGGTTITNSNSTVEASGSVATSQNSGISSSSSSVCAPIGQTCTVGADCCSVYCKSGVCACNTGGFACGEPDDCCSGFVCNGTVCAGDANTVVPCKACAGDAGSVCTTKEKCEGAAAGGTYCAILCTTNPDLCALDETCMSDGTGVSVCVPNSGACVQGDAG